MRDLDMKRRRRPLGRSGRHFSRREQRQRAERFTIVVVIILFAIFCVAMAVHGRWRATGPAHRDRQLGISIANRAQHNKTQTKGGRDDPPA